MSDDRLKQRLSDFKKALASLEQGLAIAEDELHRDGIIQRFEFTYELAWKTMKLWLAGKDVMVGNAKDALKAALENGLITDGNLWSALHRCRNLTSHTYNEATAEEVFNAIRAEALPAFRDFAARMGLEEA